VSNPLSKDQFIAQLVAKTGRQDAGVLVEQALAFLGWSDKAAFTAEEIMRIGATIADLTRMAIAHSHDPAVRAFEGQVGPVVDDLNKTLLPRLEKP
jgi:hypothetical protein